MNDNKFQPYTAAMPNNIISAAEPGHSDDQMDVDLPQPAQEPAVALAREIFHTLDVGFGINAAEDPDKKRIHDEAVECILGPGTASAISSQLYHSSTTDIPVKKLVRSPSFIANMREADAEPTTPFADAVPKRVRHDPDGSPLPASLRASRSGKPRNPDVANMSTRGDMDWEKMGNRSSPTAVQGLVAPTEGGPLATPIRKGPALFASVNQDQSQSQQNLDPQLRKGGYNKAQLMWLKQGYESGIGIVELTREFNERHLDVRTAQEIANTLSVVLEWEKMNGLLC